MRSRLRNGNHRRSGEAPAERMLLVDAVETEATSAQPFNCAAHRDLPRCRSSSQQIEGRHFKIDRRIEPHQRHGGNATPPFRWKPVDHEWKYTGPARVTNDGHLRRAPGDGV